MVQICKVEKNCHNIIIQVATSNQNEITEAVLNIQPKSMVIQVDFQNDRFSFCISVQGYISKTGVSLTFIF